MKSYTLITLLLCVLVALLATPAFGASVERREILEARNPLPKKRVSNSQASQNNTNSTSNAAASGNNAGVVGLGIMAIVVGAAAMH